MHFRVMYIYYCVGESNNIIIAYSRFLTVRNEKMENSVSTLLLAIVLPLSLPLKINNSNLPAQLATMLLIS